MSKSQLALCRRLFANWVETTDVAEQCGLTRKEMIDSAEFNDSEEFNNLHLLHRGCIVSDNDIDISKLPSIMTGSSRE